MIRSRYNGFELYSGPVSPGRRRYNRLSGSLIAKELKRSHASRHNREADRLDSSPSLSKLSGRQWNAYAGTANSTEQLKYGTCEMQRRSHHIAEPVWSNAKCGWF